MSRTYSLDAKSASSVVLTLFVNIQNAKEIGENLRKGTLNCCVIKPDLIYDAFQVVVAANKAASTEKMTTKSVHSEILYNLSFSKNITQSYQKFGLEENGKRALVAVIVKNNAREEAAKQLEAVHGEIVDLKELRNFCSRDALKKAYKLSDREVKESDILGSIVSRIAGKDLLL